MGRLVSGLRTKLGLAAVGGALLLTGMGFGAAAVGGALGTETVSDQTEVTTPAATSSEPPATGPADEPVVSAPTATVDVVTPQEQQPAPAPAPAPVPADEDRSGIGTTGPDGNYTPAPPIQRPGEPPVLPPPPPPPVPKLPGEPGYEPPTG